MNAPLKAKPRQKLIFAGSKQVIGRDLRLDHAVIG